MKADILRIGASYCTVKDMADAEHKYPLYTYYAKANETAMSIVMETIDMIDGETIVQINIDDLDISVTTDVAHIYEANNAVEIFSKKNQTEEWLQAFSKKYPGESLPRVIEITDTPEARLMTALKRVQEAIKDNCGYRSNVVPECFSDEAKSSRWMYVPVAGWIIMTVIYCKDTDDIQMSLYNGDPYRSDSISTLCSNHGLHIADVLTMFLPFISEDDAKFVGSSEFNIDSFIYWINASLNYGPTEYNEGKFHITRDYDNTNTIYAYKNDELIYEGDKDDFSVPEAFLKYMC